MISSTIGTVSASSRGTATAAAAANTDSAWADISTSTPIAATAFILNVQGGSASYTATYNLDIGIWDGSAYVEIVSNALISTDQWSGHSGVALQIPISIPKGSRIGARQRSNHASAWLDVSITLINNERQSMRAGKTITLGAVTATSRGTIIDPGGTANTKGSWVDLDTSTAAAMQGFFILIGNGGASKTSQAYNLLDIGIWDGSAYVVILADWQIACDADAELYLPNYSPLIEFPIPKGSRIGARSQSSIITATNRAFDVVLLGVC